MVANQNKNVTKLEIYAVLRSIYGNFKSEFADIFIPDMPYYKDQSGGLVLHYIPHL
jgi:hypothetical protein